jgi:hypothetical protein
MNQLRWRIPVSLSTGKVLLPTLLRFMNQPPGAGNSINEFLKESFHFLRAMIRRVPSQAGW